MLSFVYPRLQPMAINNSPALVLVKFPLCPSGVNGLILARIFRSNGTFVEVSCLPQHLFVVRLLY